MTERPRNPHNGLLEPLPPRTVTELPPPEFGVFGPETVYMDGVEYGRLHGGRWHEHTRKCSHGWGDFVCVKEAHGPEFGHELEFVDCDGDVTVDPRYT